MLLRSIIIRRRQTSWPSVTSPCNRFFSAENTITSSSDGSSKQGLARLFTDEQRELLKQAHQLSSMSRSLAKQVGNVKIREESLLVDITKCLQGGRREQKQQHETPEVPAAADEDVILPSLFTVVFAGEFNSGKSTLINALCGKELLESGVLPTTDKITVLMASEDDSISTNESRTFQVDTGVDAQTELRLLPTSTYPILSDLCIIDTPGTNAILSLQHTSSTLRLLHDADLIVFVTSADRPFSESERQLLQTSIKPYRKRVILVINKIDILERRQGDDHGQHTKRKVEEYVAENASDLLGARPIVIPVSGRDALSWKQLHRPGFVGSENESNNNNNNLWQRSNFGQLETFLIRELTASSKIKTKLSNPLGVAEGILLDCKREIERRQDDLDVDVATLKLLRSDSEAWEKDMQSILERQRSNINKEWTTRAHAVQRVLDELTLVDQLRIGVGMGRDTFDRAWENANITSISLAGKESSSFTNKLISISSECSEMLVSGAKKQGEDQIEYLGKRVSVISTGLKGNNSKMIGKIDTPKFQRLGDELQASIIPVVEKTTKHLPTDLKCADEVYTTIFRTSILSSLLMSSGVCSISLALGGFLDMSQSVILCSATLAMAGATSLPLGSRYIARSFEKEWMSNASKLESGLDALFSDALQRINVQLSDAIAPYTRFVKAEESTLISLQREMESGIADATRLRGQINKACE